MGAGWILARLFVFSVLDLLRLYRFSVCHILQFVCVTLELSQNGYVAIIIFREYAFKTDLKVVRTSQVPLVRAPHKFIYPPNPSHPQCLPWWQREWCINYLCRRDEELLIILGLARIHNIFFCFSFFVSFIRIKKSLRPTKKKFLMQTLRWEEEEKTLRGDSWSAQINFFVVMS